MNAQQRAEQLLGQLQQWAMQTVELPRGARDAFITDVAQQYYDDAVKNGLDATQAGAWRESVKEWLRQLVNVIETSGGAGGGRA